MNTFLVGYDLDKPGQDYSDLIGRLKEYPGYWHNLDSTWLIQTDDSAVKIRDELKALMDGNDKLLVINVTGRERAWTGFSAKASEWLNNQM